MTCYVYLHMESKDIKSEKTQVERYLKANQMSVSQAIEDNQPAKLHWTERQINQVVKQMRKGDTLVVFEPNHIACSTSQILEILTISATRGVSIHFVKYDVAIKNDGSEINTQHLLNIISKIESDFVSKRTTQALARRKAAGLPLGRPKGRQNKSLKLDKFKDEIEKYMHLGISKASIAKLVDCHPQTLYDWLDRKENRKPIH